MEYPRKSFLSDTIINFLLIIRKIHLKNTPEYKSFSGVFLQFLIFKIFKSWCFRTDLYQIKNEKYTTSRIFLKIHLSFSGN